MNRTELIFKSIQSVRLIPRGLWAGAAVLVSLSPYLALAQRSASPDIATPAARVFRDMHSDVSFQVPAGWNLTLKDGDVSTFRLDARSAVSSTRMHALASIAFNPYPESTFSGAFFYFSLTPRLAAADCARQASAASPSAASSKIASSKLVLTAQVGGVAFQHGSDEHGGVCTEARDEIYTATRKGSCYRFDLILNNFCGGDVSGVRDMTAAQIEAVRRRLEVILTAVHFDE
jgi:hypothetical protein